MTDKKSRFLNHRVNTIFVMLGNACNMKCRYCLQQCQELNPLPHNINDKIYDFIQQIQNGNGEDYPVCLQFYGGEPTLYYDQIKEIVSKTAPMGCEFSTISNGKAITKEMVDFFNQHNFRVAISWDGDRVLKTRGYDVFKENGENLLQLKHLCISSVLTSEAYPIELMDAQHRIAQHYQSLHGQDLLLNIDLVFDTGITDKTLIENIDYTRVEKEMHDLTIGYIDAVQNKKPYPYPLMNQYFNYIKSFYAHHKELDDIMLGKCGNGLTTLNMDLDGNLYACHNDFEPIGTIHTPFYIYLMNLLKKDCVLTRNAPCKSCIAASVCQKGCKFLPDGERQDTYCRIYQAFYGGIVKALIDYGGSEKD